MPPQTIPNDPAINVGIKTVGVGKKGSQDLTDQQARSILDDLKSGTVSDAAKGAFFAGLVLKGLAPPEKILEQAFPPGTLNNPISLAKYLTAGTPDFVQEACAKLLQGQELSKDEAYGFGQFLLSAAPGDTARGIAVSALRVRYETPDEYEGLLKAMQETIKPAFRSPVPAGPPVLQLAEPFDGVDHSYMITPLLARALRQFNCRVITMTGRNSGPKLIFNSLDIVQALGIKPAAANAELANPQPDTGWVVNQTELSPALDRWVDLRRQTIKRPFFATLEKFLNPAQARIIITSAFHPPYSEKMTTIAQRAGFPGSIVVRNGIEGTLAFGLKRPVKMLCSARRKDGTYHQEEIVVDPVALLGFEVPLEERIENPTARDNAQLIREFINTGKTSNPLFDLRVKATVAGLRQAIEWVEKNIEQE